MLKIRLQRTGRKHEPTFRVVLTEKSNGPKSGKAIEVLGNYDPRRDDETLHADRITYWISKGAQVSDTMNNLLVKHSIIKGKKVNVLPKKSPIKKEGADSAEAGAGKEEAAKAPAAAEMPAEEVKAEAEKPASEPAEAPAPEAVKEEEKEKPAPEEAPAPEEKEEKKEA